MEISETVYLYFNALTYRLKQEIARLKSEKDQIMDEMRDDQRDLAALGEEIRGLRYKLDFQNHELQKKETVIREYDTIISESSKAYDKVHI